jgi:iron-sulfur cluster repair protein YtfE (RIC family)
MINAIPALGPDDASVYKAFTADHRAMREVLGRAIASCGAGDRPHARSGFTRFAADLRAHIAAEEAVLFPIFELYTGTLDAGPTAVMRRDHRDIERRLDRIAAAFDRDDDVGAIEQELAALQALLGDHDRREELVLYPACDRFFTAGQRLAAVRGIPGRA